MSLCINSFPTRRGSSRRRSSTSARARPADYAGKDVKGAVVLGSAAAGQLWQQAVKARGAIGVISTAIAPYIRPNDPAQFTFPGSVGRLPVGQRPVRRGREGLRLQGEPARGVEDARAAEGGPVKVKVDVQVHVLRRPEPLRRRRNPRHRQARRADRDGRAHPGARRERRRERVRDAAGAGGGAAEGHRGEGAGRAGPHADVHLGRREPRQPRLADRRIPSRRRACSTCSRWT